VREIAEIVEIFYVRQKHALGLGHAVLCDRDFVGNEPFTMLLGDDIIDAPTPCLGQLLKAYRKYRGTVLALERVPWRTSPLTVVFGRHRYSIESSK
jgi:UTP--glucose-1-phosphate uridylyltransferase